MVTSGAFAEWADTTVTVTVPGARDPWTGSSSASTTSVPAMLTERVTMVRNADGIETVSSATILVDVAYRSLFGVNTTVTLPGRARPTVVLSTATVDVGDPDLDGVEVALA